jgi:DNA-binding NarL/FixJ family response regulator
MASSTATTGPSPFQILERPITVDSGDTVTQRRVRSALAAAGHVAAPVDPAADPVVVLTVDLADAEAGDAIRLARESSPGASVVVVTPGGTDSEVRRALRAGALGVVFDGQLELTLAPAVRAVAAGFVVVPRALRQQVLRPVFSHREREVLGLVAEGATNREIADRLFLAESTVKSHLSTAFTKLGVRTRAEAAALVLDPGTSPIHGLCHTPSVDTGVDPSGMESKRGAL